MWAAANVMRLELIDGSKIAKCWFAADFRFPLNQANCLSFRLSLFLCTASAASKYHVHFANVRVNFQTESLTPHFHFNFLISFPLRLECVTRECAERHTGNVCRAHSPFSPILHHRRLHHTHEWYEFNQITIYYCVWWVLAVRETIQKVKFKYSVDSVSSFCRCCLPFGI